MRYFKQDALDKQAQEVKAFAATKRRMAAMGLGGVVWDPKHGGALTEADARTNRDRAMGLRIGAMASTYVGARQDLTLTRTRNRAPAGLSPEIAAMTEDYLLTHEGAATLRMYRNQCWNLPD